MQEELEEGEGEVAACAVARENNVLGRDVQVVQQVQVRRQGVLDCSGEGI